MSVPKQGIAQNAGPMHYSVGAILRQSGKIILIDRATPPLGFAGIAGHVDEGEDAVTALRREVLEESGLTVTSYTLIAEEELDWNWCSKGTPVHYWYLFECKAVGELTLNKHEVKSIDWYTQEQIQPLPLEPVWAYWFKKLKIVPL